MSKRKRHAQKQSDSTQIEWLKHRTGYPSPEERERIVELRQELLIELVSLMVTGVKPDNAQIRRLAEKYSAEELERATRLVGEFINLPMPIAEDAKSYREYRQRYARFGAGLKFYTAREMDELQETHARSVKESGDLRLTTEINKLLLFGWRDWKDITPPAIPLRPDDYIVPQPASYPAPINELLEWGDDLHRSHKFANETDFIHWRKYIPALTRMALDPGLLNGWVTEKSCWAPWHAIHALGALQAWESAPALARLADLENDWLSDHLPHIWANMGMEVEPSLWMILEDPSASPKQRGLAAQSLFMITEDDESDAMLEKVTQGFEKMLGNTKTFNPTVNAYMIHFLREMDAVDEIWETVELAFDEERVDLDIITPEDLEEDYDDDEFDDDNFGDDDFDDDEE
jgi:hypothetical protein